MHQIGIRLVSSPSTQTKRYSNLRSFTASYLRIINRRHFFNPSTKMSTSLPSTMKAIVINGNKAKVAEIPLPKIRPTYLLAKVDSIALNPTDWKHINGKRAAPNGISGCDFAGTVVEVGPEVTKSFKPGDRVAGTVHGANYSHADDGCFSEYAIAKADLLVHLPDDLPFEKAATFPLGTATVGQGLFQTAVKLNLPDNPSTKGETVLIYVSVTG